MPTYRQVLALPDVAALLAASALARLAEGMVSLGLVLYCLARFESAALAGWVAFAATAPGLVVSPLAGALLDRIGARGAIRADLAASTILIAALAMADATHLATPWSTVGLAGLYSLTSPLSWAGIRTLLPRLVPIEARDRVNALDSTVYAVVEVIGPPLIGVAVGVAGPAIGLALVALAYGLAWLSLGWVRGLSPRIAGTPPFLHQALDGLRFVLGDPSLRGLALGYSAGQITWGILTVTVPVVLADALPREAADTGTGLLWAMSGLAGGAGALVAGHVRVSGREVPVMALGFIATGLAVWPIAATGGLGGLALGLALAGFLSGPINVAVLSLRQGRTAPDRLGRVLAVSISLNTAGFPIGTAIGGVLVTASAGSAFAAAAVSAFVAALLIWLMIPKSV